jgi:hypothetical protein
LPQILFPLLALKACRKNHFRSLLQKTAAKFVRAPIFKSLSQNSFPLLASKACRKIRLKAFRKSEFSTFSFKSLPQNSFPLLALKACRKNRSRS